MLRNAEGLSNVHAPLCTFPLDFSTIRKTSSPTQTFHLAAVDPGNCKAEKSAQKWAQFSDVVQAEYGISAGPKR
jgi:hypothetical protein